jgi:SPP1 gp7 family putative phage head morphogenesis protein
MIKVDWNLPFLEQLEYFRSKGVVLSPESWRDVWKQANSRAFTVAQVTEMDVLHDIRAALDQAKESGMTLKDFKAKLQPTLEKKGWLAPEGEEAKILLPDGTVRKRLTGWRLDNIFATNSQETYSVGRYKQLQEVKQSRPYWMYVAVMDSATRPDHAAMNGKIYHADHPFWDQWYPPNGFRCRCYVRTLSARQMKKLGLKEETSGVGIKPDKGFDYNPGQTGLDHWKPDLDKYTPEERRLLEGALNAGA